MNNRAFTISFIVAVLAVSMVYSYVSATEEEFKKQYGTEKAVVVAKKNIKELDILDESNLTLVNVPSKFVQPGTSATINDFKSALAIDPAYGEADFNLAVVYATRTPPQWDLAKKHYADALKKGVKPDSDMEKLLQGAK